MIGDDVSNKFELWEELKHIRFNINVKHNKRFVREYCESITTFDSETSNGFINPKTGFAEGYNLAFGKTDEGIILSQCQKGFLSLPLAGCSRDTNWYKSFFRS